MEKIKLIKFKKVIKFKKMTENALKLKQNFKKGH